jgi:carboxyl-terminal processing protease
MPRLAFRPLALFALVAASAAIIGAQAPQLNPTATDQVTAQIVVKLLEQSHMAKPKIDDETAKKWAKTFIKDLDPQKYNFLKSDVAEFLAEETTLDDKIKEGDITWAKKVMERYVQRSDERYKDVVELIKVTPDFTLEESYVDDPEKAEYPADATEAKERLRKKLKLELLERKVSKVDSAEALKKLAILYKDRNRAVHQFSSSDLLEFYLSSLTKTFDPHSSYMGPNTLEDMMTQQLHLSLQGIGASLQSEDGYAVVKELVPNGPADKDARIQPEDKILGIQKEDGEEISFVEKKLSDVVRDIRGPAGTKVRLIIQPAETKERKIYELTRAKIELAEAHAKGQVIETKNDDGKAIKVGVIGLPAFYGDTGALNRNDPDAVSATEDCRKLLKGFKAQGVDAVMVDLRDNGGGLLLEAITLSGLFIDNGPVVQVKEASGVKHLDDEDAGTAWDGPLVVLINRLSASASEIFAGVIKDYGRGLIIGDASTYGKGTVQSIVPINEQLGRRSPNLGALKLTIQQFYRANGESTQINGVKSDIHIPSLRDVADINEGKMDNALAFDRVAPLPHDNFDKLSQELVSSLEIRSLERRKASDKFRKQDEQIKKAVDRKARHSISLNEDKFRAEFVPDEDDDKADGVDEKTKEKKRKKRYGERTVWEPDFYNDEILKIVADYLTIGSDKLASTTIKAAAARP